MLTKIGRWRIIKESNDEGKWKLYDRASRPTKFVVAVHKTQENNFQVSLIKEHDITSKRARDWAISEEDLGENNAVEIAKLWINDAKIPECPMCDSDDIESLGKLPPSGNPSDEAMDAYGCIECRTLFYKN